MLDNVDAALESAIASHEAGDLIVAGEKISGNFEGRPKPSRRKS